MGIQLAVLEVAFTSTGAGKVQSDVAGVGAAIDESAAGAASGMATFAGAAGLLADAALGMSVKAAASFQSLMNTIQNNTTLSNSDMVQLASSVKSMAQQSGASIDQLGAAYMHTTNFGYSFADSQKIVEAGMQSAVSTGSNVGDTVNVLAGAMKEFGISADDAGRAMDVLHEAAATGNMTLEQLVESSGKMLSTAANLKVPLTDVAAGMSALTEHGFTAANAGVAMTNMMTKIIAPSAGAQKELAALSKTTGIDLVSDFTSAGLASRGMPAILDDIARATGGNADTLHKLFPELRAFQGALALTGTASADYAKELGLMSDAMSGKITPTADAFQRTLGTLGNELERAKASIQVLAINIGTVLLPPLAAIASVVADAVGWLANLSNAHAPLIAAILGAVGAIGTFIGGMAVLNSGFVAGIPLIGGLIAAISPFVVPLLAIAAAAAALYVAWSQNWGGIRGVFTSIWNDVQPGLNEFENGVMALAVAFRQLTSGHIAIFFTDIGVAIRDAARGFREIGGMLWADIQKPDWGGILGDAGGDIMAALKAGGGLTARLAGWIAGEVAAIPWSSIWSGIQGGGAAIVAGLEAGGSIAVDLATWLADQIAGINWATVWGGIKSAGSAVLSGLTRGANITVQLAQWLAGQVQNLPWATVWSGIQNAGSAILTGLEAGADITGQLTAWLAGQVGAIDWSAVWANAKGAAGAALAMLQQGAQTAAGAVQQGAQTVSSQVQNHSSDIQNAAGDIGGALSGLGSDASAGLQAAETAVQGLQQAIAGLAAGPLATVRALFSGLGDDINSKLGPAKDVIDGLASAFASLAGKDLSQLVSIVESIASGIAKLVATNAGPAFQAIEQAVSALATAFSRWAPLVNDVGSALSALSGPAGAVASILAGALLAAFDGLLSVVGVVGDAIQAALPGAFQVAQGAITVFLGVFQTISGIVSGVIAVVGDLLSGNWSQAWKDAQTAVQTVIDGVKTILSGIGQTFTGLISAATGMILVVWTAGWQLLETAVSTTISAVVTLAGSIGGKIVAAVGNLGSLLFQVGVDVVQGLINGIESMVGSLVNAVGNLISNIPGASKIGLKSNSPSRVMAEIGDFVVQGLVQGIEGGRADIQSAAGSMAQAVIDGAEATLEIASPSKWGKRTGTNAGQAVATGVAATKPDLKTAAGLAAVGIPEGFAETLLNGGATVSASVASMLKLALQRASDESQGGSAQVADDLQGYIAAELAQTGSIPAAALVRGMTTALRSLNGSGLSDAFLQFITGNEALTGEQFSTAAVTTMSKAWQQLTDVNRGGSQASLQAFEDYVQGWIAMTGELPTDAWVKAHETMWQRLANTNRGGSTQNAQAFFDYLTQIENVLGTDLSPAAQQAYEKVWLTLTNTSAGGSQALLDVFTQLTVDIANELGQPLSDAAMQALAGTLERIQQQSGDVGVAAAQSLIEGYTQTFDQAPSSQVQNWIARQIAQSQPTQTGWSMSPGNPETANWAPQAYYQLTPTYGAPGAAAQSAINMGGQLQQQTGVAPDVAYLQQASKFFDGAGNYLSASAATAAGQFNSALANAITATGNQPSQAFDAMLRTVLMRADDTASGGSQQLGDMITGMIATTIDATGSVPSDAAVRTFGDIISRLGDTLHGGSVKLANDFNTWFSQYLQENGQAPSTAMQQQVASLLQQAGDTAHGGSQALADQLLNTLTAQMQQHGGQISESFLKMLNDMFVNGEGKGKSAATIVGADIPKALASGIDSAADLPSEAVTKVLKLTGDTATDPATKTGKKVGTALGQGIADGVKSQADAIAAITAEAAKAATDAASKAIAAAGSASTAWWNDPKQIAQLHVPRTDDAYGLTPSGGINVIGGFVNMQQPPIVVEAHLYVDGEQMAHNTTTVMSKQLRMNAPLVGADRVRI